jgi:hypothetical protein
MVASYTAQDIISNSNIPYQLGGNPNGAVLGTGPTDLIGFWGTTPVAQTALIPTGLTATVTAGSTTTVFTNTTFNGGGTGAGLSANAYTLGDLVFALKTSGAIP